MNGYQNSTTIFADCDVSAEPCGDVLKVYFYAKGLGDEQILVGCAVLTRWTSTRTMASINGGLKRMAAQPKADVIGLSQKTRRAAAKLAKEPLFLEGA